MYSAVRMLAADAKPMIRDVKRNMRVAVEPTLPSAEAPENVPTTATSVMLNKTCNIFESISGRLNNNIFFHKDPSVIVISVIFVLFFIATKILSPMVENYKNNFEYFIFLQELSFYNEYCNDQSSFQMVGDLG